MYIIIAIDYEGEMESRANARALQFLTNSNGKSSIL